MEDSLSIPEELTQESLDIWADTVKEHLDLWVFFLTLQKDGSIVLNSIIVKPNELKQGKGTKAMNLLTDLADYHQRRIWLTPGEKDKYHKTTSRNRLIRFYRRFGFIRNKGRNKDYRSTEMMYRRPISRSNPTDPLPPSLSGSIALMTKKEFLDFQNPADKYHGPDAYDFDLASLNRNYELRHVEDYRANEGIFRIYRSEDNFLIEFSTDRSSSFSLVAVIYDGILYYKSPSILHRLPKGYRSDRDAAWMPFDIMGRKRVKYLQEYISLIDDIKNRNLQKYPLLHQNIKVDGESFQIRSSQPLVLDKGISIVIINNEGEVVAQASNEWGATLLVVAKEYRKRGLGKALGKLWGQWNPSFTSGGFTSKGRAAATAIWEAHVREFRAKGWYSELLKQELITKQRISEIFSGLGKIPIKRVRKKPKKREILIFVEKEIDSGETYWGPTFIVYDKAFLDDPDEKYLYGFGFFRDSEWVGSFLYTIDYDRPFEKLTTYIALQIARNNGEKIYIGEGYGDLLEFEDLDNVEQEGDYVFLTKDVLDLDLFSRFEALIRQSKDSYDAKYHQLIEMAHAKWD